MLMYFVRYTASYNMLYYLQILSCPFFGSVIIVQSQGRNLLQAGTPVLGTGTPPGQRS